MSEHRDPGQLGLKLTLVILAAALAALVLIALPAWFWHPLGACAGTHAQVVRCKGYNWWSGIGSVFTPKDLAVVFVVVTWYRQHNCHEQRCPRLAWHPHPDHGHPVCKHHHPHDPANLGGAS